MNLQGPDFSDSRDLIFFDSRDPMMILADSRGLIFNSKDLNRSLKHLKKLCIDVCADVAPFEKLGCFGSFSSHTNNLQLHHIFFTDSFTKNLQRKNCVSSFLHKYLKMAHILLDSGN